MTLTLAIPTWKQITDVIFLAVAYYSTLVAPQFDWVVFGVVYYFGVCVALRSWWRLNRCPMCRSKDFDLPCCCLLVPATYILWPLLPLFGLTKFLVTFGNSKSC